MEVAELTLDEVRDWTLLALGTDHGEEFEAASTVAESLRRVSSVRSPLSKRRLRSAVYELLRPLASDSGDLRDSIRVQLELLLSAGDLLEMDSVSVHEGAAQILLAPPAFVEHAGCFVLLGVRPGTMPLVGEMSPDQIEYKGHLRIIKSNDGAATRRTLIDYGLDEIELNGWLRSPNITTPGSLLDHERERLSAATPTSSGIEDVEIIDSHKPVDYYRARWRAPAAGDTGLFVGRRPRQYGSAMWCVCELKEGVATRFVELPTYPGIEHGRDEAWMTQLALDQQLGRPQEFRVASLAGSDAVIFDFFGPLPTWAVRRLSVFGEPVDDRRGALFSFNVGADARSAVAEFLESGLWMQEAGKEDVTG